MAISLFSFYSAVHVGRLNMAVEKVFLISLLLFSFSSRTFQDGFNFYKALNRTPLNRVERFNRDGFNSKAFKVPLPLTKRLLYDGLVDKDGKLDESVLRTDEESLSIFLNWFPSNIKFSDFPMKDANFKKCEFIQELLSRLDCRI